jgi:RNA recognition motif-containing protein
VASFASEEFAKKCIEQMKDFDLKNRKLAARELAKNDELRLARLAKHAPHAPAGNNAAATNGASKFAARRSAQYPSRSPAQFGRPPSLLGGLGALAASQSPFGSSPFGASPFGASPFGASPVAAPSAEYGAPSGASGGAPAPLERVLAALRQERVLSETQLADLGVSPSALKSLGVDFDRYLTNQVFVSNLAYTVNHHDVRRALSAAGRVERVKIPTTGTGDEEHHAGYGVVTFESIYDAIQAIQMFNMKMLFDRTVKVRTYVPDELGYFSRPRGTPESAPTRSYANSRPPAVGELVGSSTGPVLPYPAVAPAPPNAPWPSSSAPIREAHEQWGGFSRGPPAAPFRAPAVGPSMNGTKAIAAADETAAIIVKNLPGTYDETEVQRLFRSIASAIEVELLRDSMGRSMGIARVRFPSPADAIRVVRKLILYSSYCFIS